jgi:SAM-dependent methyltransferase
VRKISPATVRRDFNDVTAVVHYAKAAHGLGLWESERIVLARFLPDPTETILELGCGAGRVTVALWTLGYRRITALDFAAEPLDQARALAAERGATDLDFLQADATALPFAMPGEPPHAARTRPAERFAAVLFMFNGLMQIPRRSRRRRALREARRVARPGAPLVFTTHDREDSRVERALWKLEAVRWQQGTQDSRLVEFGDRYFEDEAGRTFMHLPTRAEVLEDLAATGWTPVYDEMRRRIARESPEVVAFSDECRFWVARA